MPFILKILQILVCLMLAPKKKKNGFNDICLQDKSKTNLMSDLSTHHMTQM